MSASPRTRESGRGAQCFGSSRQPCPATIGSRGVNGSTLFGWMVCTDPKPCDGDQTPRAWKLRTSRCGYRHRVPVRRLDPSISAVLGSSRQESALQEWADGARSHVSRQEHPSADDTGRPLGIDLRSPRGNWRRRSRGKKRLRGDQGLPADLDHGFGVRIVLLWPCPVAPFRWVWMVFRRWFVWRAGLPSSRHLHSRNLSAD